MGRRVLNGKREAVIVDLDGTLCNVEHRLHFLTESQDFDAFNAHCVDDRCYFGIYEMVKYFDILGYNIVFLTGRSDKYRKETEEWFLRKGIEYDGLFMRPDKNREKDFVFKRGIYYKEIERIYEVFLVIEDKQSVADMWRKEGLFCLQFAASENPLFRDSVPLLG